MTSSRAYSLSPSKYGVRHVRWRQASSTATVTLRRGGTTLPAGRIP
jgi:hypothetical protein